MTPYEQEAHDNDPFYVSHEEIEAAIEAVSFATGNFSTECLVRCRNGLTIVELAAGAHPDIIETVALDKAREVVRHGLRYEKATNAQRFAAAERELGLLMAVGEHGGE